MKFTSNDMEAIVQAIEDHSHVYIRLVLGTEGITPFNLAKVDRMEHFRTKIQPFLESKNTPVGTYIIEGRHSGKKETFPMVTIEKNNGIAESKPAAPVQKMPIINSKAEANLDLIQENARLTFENKYLTEKLETAQETILDLENQLTEMENQITEMENKEDETEKQKTLSEPAQLLTEFVKPFIPAMQNLAANFLAEYMNKKQFPNGIPQQPQQPGAENTES
jgi:predicted ribosome quality control (RQC) complex YloA/Tae2 family protein